MIMLQAALVLMHRGSDLQGTLLFPSKLASILIIQYESDQELATGTIWWPLLDNLGWTNLYLQIYSIDQEDAAIQAAL